MAPHLLVLEDDADSLEMLSMLLETCGFDVVATDGAQEAKEQLRHRAFELVIADFIVGAPDPVESWRTIDELVQLASPAPVGLLTAWPITPEQLDEHGLAFALAKPCDGETLMSTLGHTLDVPPLAPELAAKLRAYFDRIEQSDWDGVADLCTDDVLYHLPSSHPDFGNTVHGRAAFRAFTESTFRTFREPRFGLEELRALPRGAVVRYVCTWTDTSNHRQQLAGSVLFMLRGDRISEIGVRLDPAGLRTAC
jgi:CheY-like chemotaxis protein